MFLCGARLSLLIGLVTLFAGCATTRRLPMTGAAGVGTPAILVEQRGSDGFDVDVEVVDGQRVPRDSTWGSTRWEIEVAPGRHSVEVSYVDGQSHSTQNATISFAAAPGGRYEIHGARIEDDIAEPGTRIATSLSAMARGSWVAWIVDTQTGAVVGGRKPDQQPARAPARTDDEDEP